MRNYKWGVKYFLTQTPAIFKFIGTFFLLTIPIINLAIPQMPVTENQRFWIKLLWDCFAVGIQLATQMTAHKSLNEIAKDKMNE